MQIIIVFQRFFEHFLNEKNTHPVVFWIVTIISVIQAGLVLFVQIEQMRPCWRNYSLFEKLIGIISCILSISLLPLIFIVIVCSGDVVVGTTDLLNNQFFIEIILLSTGLAILKLIKIYYTEDDEDDDDSDGAIVLKSILLIIVSGIFIFTNLENNLVTWGFKLFHHDIGAWILGLYTAWAGASVIRFIEAIAEFFSILPSIITLNKSVSNGTDVSANKTRTATKYLIGSIACLLLVFLALFGIFLFSENAKEPYTWEEINAGILQDRPAINSVHDEQDFVFAKEAIDGTDYTSEDIVIEGEEEFWILVSIHNDNPEKNIVAKNVNLRVSLDQVDDNKCVVSADLSSSNAEPYHLTDTFSFSAATPFHLEYYTDSTYIYSHFGNEQKTMKANGDAVSKDGILVGYDAPDGDIPGGEYVTVSIKVKVFR